MFLRACNVFPEIINILLLADIRDGGRDYVLNALARERLDRQMQIIKDGIDQGRKHDHDRLAEKGLLASSASE